MAINNEVLKFIKFHRHQLNSVPESLWEKLYYKLKELKFDAGEVFQLHLDKIKDTYTLHLKDGCCLEAGSDIFLIDHSWTTRPENARDELKNTPGLLDRMENLFNIKNKMESEKKNKKLNGNESENEEDDEDDEESNEDIENDNEENLTTEQKETIDIVVSQTGKSRQIARKALESHNYEIINAIGELTSEDMYDTNESEIMKSLQDTISGQLPEKDGKKSKKAKKNHKKNSPPTIESRIEKIVKYEMWKYIKVYQYTVLTDGEEENILTWYFLDEVGNALQHSSSPNTVCIPFIYNNGAENVAYSILYPVKNIASGEMITQNKLPADILKNENDAEKISYLMSFDNDPLEDNPRSCEKLLMYKKNELKKQADSSIELKQPSDNVPYIDEKLKNKEKENSIKVYTDLLSIRFNLKADNIEFVDDINKADIIWIEDEVETFKNNQKLSRFPNQICLTNPIYLRLMLNKVYGNENSILSECYDLSTELAEFVSSYISIEKKIKEIEKENINSKNKKSEKPLKNYWILKPVLSNNGHSKPNQWILTDSLARIVRHRDSKINYIVERYYSFNRQDKITALYNTDFNNYYDISNNSFDKSVSINSNHNVKFQLRFIVLLCSSESTQDSTSSLSLYMYDKYFSVKLANEYFSGEKDQIDNKNIHFVNYKERNRNRNENDGNQNQDQDQNINTNPKYFNFIHPNRFIKFIESNAESSGYGYNSSWKDLKSKIYQKIKDVFSAAISSPEPLGFSEICKNLPAFFSVFAVDVEIVNNLGTCDNSKTNATLEPLIVNIEYLPDGGSGGNNGIGMMQFDPGFLTSLLNRVTNGKVVKGMKKIQNEKESFILL